LALVGVATADLRDARSAIAGCFSETSSVEWKDLTGDIRKQACARSLVKAAVGLAAQGTLAITVLTWDLHDTRHAVPGRDDIRNTERMYYHAISALARKRRVTGLSLYPDETSDALDFRHIQRYLNTTTAGRVTPPLLESLEREPERFRVTEVQEQVSEREPLVQLADLFAGMMRTSLEYSADLKRWRSGGQLALLGDQPDDPVSRGRRAKFDIIDIAKAECAHYRLGVSLDSHGYLCTPKPTRPIHFWLWQPQGDYDKAPTNRTVSVRGG
jgi:hypothetical protein